MQREEKTWEGKTRVNPIVEDTFQRINAAQVESQGPQCGIAGGGHSISPGLYFFKKALKRSMGRGRKVVVLCSLAISRMVWR